MDISPQSARELSIWESGYVVAGRYEVVRCLGIGSMGIVYLCRHRSLDGFLVALKVLCPSTSMEGSEEQFYARFRNEILATRTINHPNVVCTYDYVSEPGLEAYSMEYMRGGDLANYLRRITHIDLRSVVEMLTQMCAGVQAIHDANFMHRDLKPENFLLSGSRQVKIADFGIARAEYGPRITARGGVVGTVQYLSPEYLQTSEYTKQGDIYALGTLAYEMITGVLPYAGHNVFQTVELKLRSDPPLLESRNPACPESLSRVVMRALSRDLSQRYQTAGELEAAFRQVLELESLRGSAGPRRSINLPSYSPSLAGLHGAGSTRLKLARWLPVRAPRHPARLGLIMTCGILIGMLPVLYHASRVAREQAASRIAASTNGLPSKAVSKPLIMPNSAALVENSPPAAVPRKEPSNADESFEPIVRSDQAELLEETHQPLEPEVEKDVGVERHTSEHRELLLDTERETTAAKPARKETSNLESAERRQEPRAMLPATKQTAPDAAKLTKGHEDIGSSESRSTAKDKLPPSTLVSPVNAPKGADFDPAPEYKVRATLLYRFADYLEWPSASLPPQPQPFTICIAGKDPFGAYLDRAVAEVRTQGGRAIRINRLSRQAPVEFLRNCQIAYLGNMKRSSVDRITQELGGSGTVTVAEDTGRGMVDFVVKDRKIKFELSPNDLERSGLKVKQVLLDLAVRVR